MGLSPEDMHTDKEGYLKCTVNHFGIKHPKCINLDILKSKINLPVLQPHQHAHQRLGPSASFPLKTTTHFYETQIW